MHFGRVAKRRRATGVDGRGSALLAKTEYSMIQYVIYNIYYYIISAAGFRRRGLIRGIPAILAGLAIGANVWQAPRGAAAGRNYGAKSADRPVAFLRAPAFRAAHVFIYRPPPHQPAPSSVNIAGDFNGWSTTANPLRRTAPDLWQTSVRLTPGIHYYKLVINGNQWMADPLANPALAVSNGMGSYNSGVRIASPWQKLPPPRPNRVPTSAIAFNPVNFRQCDVVSRHDLRLALTVRQGGLSAAGVAVTRPGGKWRRFPLEIQGTRLGATTWGTMVQVSGRRSHYYFRLRQGTQTLYLAGGAFYIHRRAAAANAYTRVLRSPVVTPAWARRAIWYEIFVERFRNGDKANDPPHHVPWRWSWFRPYRPAGEKGNFYSYVYNRFYGGDIQGIRRELPYLRKLGVNALYLTPVFEAPSIHKYDPTDYRHIDDGFGVKGSLRLLHGEKVRDPQTWQWSLSDKVFLHFLSAAHAQGFKVIIDVPFGHCGRYFGPFLNVLKYGRRSPYAGWFQIIHWGPPVQYRAWDGINGAMPLFKPYPGTGLAPGVCRYFGAVTRRWMAPNGNPANGVDGWRLDSPQTDVPHTFWIAWRKLVKNINPQALIIGEIWTPAQVWLNKGNQFDGVMNYPFANICTLFFADHRGGNDPGIGPRRLGEQLQTLLNWYHYQTDLVQQNLIDSQDTDRFVSRFMNPDLPFNGADRLQDSNPHYNVAQPTPEDYLRLRQVAAFQMTFAGAPMIWYGDEVGMWGASDPSDRQPMVWKDMMPYDDPRVRVHEGLLRFYRRAIAARRQLLPLELGSYGELKIESRRDVFIFHRDLDHQHVYVALNRSGLAQWVRIPVFASDIGHHLLNYLSRRQMKLVYPPAGDIAGRPILARNAGIRGYRAGRRGLRIRLRPWGSAILARYAPGRFASADRPHDTR